MTNVPRAKQVTALSKALSHTRLYQSEGPSAFGLENVYEGEVNLIHISIHIFMNCVVFVLKAR